jgi:hypothetical protein
MSTNKSFDKTPFDKTHEIKKRKKNKKRFHAGIPKTINQFCEMYKKDILGNPTKDIYESCKINKLCRKTKCQNIDKKFHNTAINKLGKNYKTLLLGYINSKCINDIPNTGNKYKKCFKKNTKKFYQNYELGNLYDKILECDNKTCKNEHDRFYSNIYKNIKNKHVKPNKNIEDQPDLEMIKNN